MTNATMIVEVDGVSTCWVGIDPQEAVCVVITVGLSEPGASQPPGRSIGCPPSLLLRDLGVHWVPGATATTVGRTSDINDEVRGTQWRSGVDDHFPVGAASRREELHAFWATVSLGGPVHIEAIFTLDQSSSRVPASEVDIGTLTRFRRARVWRHVIALGLAVVRLGVIVAAAIVEGDDILVLGFVRQVQVTVCVVVSVGLAVFGAAKPPWRSI
jgi:hypothetical protein